MNSMRWKWLTVIVVCIGSGACKKPSAGPVTISSSTTPTTTSPATTEATAAVSSADEIVRKVADFYKRSAAAEVEIVESSPNVIGPATRTVKLTIQRPDKIAVRGIDELSVDYIQNGATAFTVVKPMKKYFEAPSAGNLDVLAKTPSTLALMGFGVMFAPTLFCNDPYTAMMDGVNSVEYVAKESVENTECHRIKFNQPNLMWEMWVDASDSALVHKLEINPVVGLNVGAATKFSVSYKNWKRQTQLPPETFAFKPPEGFEKMDDVGGLFGGIPGLPELPGGLPPISGLPEIPGLLPGIPGAPPANPAGQPIVPGGVPTLPPGSLPAVPGGLPTVPDGTPIKPPSPPAGETKPSG